MKQLSISLLHSHIISDELPNLGNEDEYCIPSAQPDKYSHSRVRSPIPDDALIIEISDSDSEIETEQKWYFTFHLILI